jgi:hypothetical protein
MHERVGLQLTSKRLLDLADGGHGHGKGDRHGSRGAVLGGGCEGVKGRIGLHGGLERVMDK